MEAITPGEQGRKWEELLRELEEAQAELKDLEELRRAFLGQTGVHIGMRVLQSVQRQFEHEEARLKERIALLQDLLKERQ